MIGRNDQIVLDMGNDTVRIIIAENKQEHIEIKALGTAAIPEGAFRDNMLVCPGLLANAIKEAAVNAGIKGPRKVCFSADPRDTVIRYLELPEMTDQEAREALKWEVAKSVPFEGRAVFDFIVLKRDAGTMKVLLAATEEKKLADICACIKEAGLVPVAVDIEPLALARLIPANGQEPHTTILVNLEESYTSIGFFKNQQLLLHRVFPMGVRELKAPADGEETVSARLINELSRSIKFFQMQYRDEDISRLFLAIGEANLCGFEEKISEQLAVSVQVLNPPTQHGREVRVGLGTVMRSQDPQALNLLPQGCIETRMVKLPKYLIAAMAAILVVGTLYFGYLYKKLVALEAENLSNKQVAARLSGDAVPTNVAEKRAMLSKQLIQDRPILSSVLDKVFTSLPAGMEIIRVTQLETGELLIFGTGQSNGQITSYVEKLKEHPGLTNLSIKIIQEIGTEKYQFELLGPL